MNHQKNRHELKMNHQKNRHELKMNHQKNRHELKFVRFYQMIQKYAQIIYRQRRWTFSLGVP